MIAGPGDLALPRLRQGLYRFFASAMLPPESERVERLDPAADLLEDLGVDTLAFAQPWSDMRRALAMRPPLERLEAEYVHLFESGTDGALCPPVESYYVASPRHGGPAVVTADLEVEFRRLGMEPAKGSQLGVDHICSQLELMALMCANEAAAGEDGGLESVATWSRDQRQFTDNHLSRWVPRFAERVRQAEVPGLYRHVVVTLGAFIDHDRELLHLLDRRERTGLRS